LAPKLSRPARSSHPFSGFSPYPAIEPLESSVPGGIRRAPGPIPMLSGGDDGVPDGIGMARLAWTRLPTADAEGAGPSTSAAAACDELFSAAAVESLDYEVIENYAYREEQVRAAPRPPSAAFLPPERVRPAQSFVSLGVGCRRSGASSGCPTTSCSSGYSLC